jgi:UDP-N-acetylglucosamine 2-epimerase
VTAFAYVVGTRPNFVKMAPVIHELRLRLPDAPDVVIHTDQHFDCEMSTIFLDELGMPERSRARLPSLGFDGAPLTLIEPVGYLDFLALEAHATAVVTDSGGVQEETTYLRIPCFTLRDGTERPGTVAHCTNRVLGLRFGDLDRLPALVPDQPVPLSPPPLWDGRPAERIADILLPGSTGIEILPCAESAVR